MLAKLRNSIRMDYGTPNDGNVIIFDRNTVESSSHSISNHSQLIPIDYDDLNLKVNSDDSEYRDQKNYEKVLQKQRKEMFNLIYKNRGKRQIKSKTLSRETDEFDKDADDTVYEEDEYDSDDEFQLFSMDSDE